MRNRAERRWQNKRIKKKVVDMAPMMGMLTRPEFITPAWVGKTAATHWTCMCWQCKPPYKWRKPAFEQTHPNSFYE